MNSRDITVFLDERWCNALEAYTGLTMESLLTGQMDTLIQQLPQDQREQIIQDIQREEQMAQVSAEANRRFSLTRIIENGESQYCLLERGEIMFQTALRLRRYLRGELQDPSQFYGDAWPITQEEMEQYTAEMLRGSPRVVGIYDIDLDAGKVYSLDADKGWRGYPIKAVSTAVYFACKRELDDWIAKRSRFYARLNGTELPNDDRPIFIRGSDSLPVSDLSFSKDIEECKGMLIFRVSGSFDQDKVFGTHVETKENSDYLNLFASYDMDEGQISNTLWVYLWEEDGAILECEYRLTPEEQEVLLSKMDSYCMEKMGTALETAREQYLAKEQRPTSQEPLQQAGPTLQM